MKADLSKIIVTRVQKTGLAIVSDNGVVINKGNRPQDNAFAYNVEKKLEATFGSGQQAGGKSA
jgi:LytS/YehU family sensor histidine kinase